MSRDHHNQNGMYRINGKWTHELPTKSSTFVKISAWITQNDSLDDVALKVYITTIKYSNNDFVRKMRLLNASETQKLFEIEVYYKMRIFT